MIRLKTSAIIIGYIAGYVFLDWVSYIHPVLPLAITPWNPPPGLSLAFLLRFGLRNWPALFAATLLAETLVRGLPAPIGYVALASAVLTAGYSGAAALLVKVLGFNPSFGRMRDLTTLLAVSVAGALLVGIGLVAVYSFAGWISREAFMEAVFRFWVGDVLGIMVVTPLLLAFSRSLPKALLPLRVPSREAVIQALSVALALWVIFGLDFTDEFKFFYLLFLPLIWIAMRHGIRGTTLALAGIQAGLIAAVQWGGHRTVTVLEFQLLMLALAITGLFLGMTVTRRKEIEERLREQQRELDDALRLAAAGELAASLAHEINQPLSAIGSYVRSCQLLLSRDGAGGPLFTETLGKVVREVERAGAVVHRLREFFRSGVTRLEPLSVAQLVENALERVARRAERHRIAVESEVAAGLPPVLADQVQISTVLHNLLTNSIDAIASSNATRRQIRLRAKAGEGGNVRVAVSDSGPGISPDLAQRLFEPFSTTKPEGLGLGLRISRSLVEAHGGKLWLDHVPEGGAMFCFTLPVQGASGYDNDAD